MADTDIYGGSKDWKAINRSRPEERKKVDQKTRKFIPLTDAVIENHLLGEETIGVRPLLPDETCWFLAADFDKKTWEYDSLTLLEACRELNARRFGTFSFREVSAGLGPRRDSYTFVSACRLRTPR